MEKFIHTMMDIGLSESQARVYVTILENGASLITDIAKKSGLKRTSVTNYINELLDLGYISQSLQGKRIAYIAESPDYIVKDLERKQEQFAKHLPELNSIFLASSTKANIRYFEGKSGLRQMYREINTQFKPILTFFSVEQYLKVLTIDDMNENMANIMKNDNTIHDLMEDTPFAREFMKPRIFPGKKAHWLPKGFKVPIDLMIYGDSVAMMSFSKQMGVIIENKEIADFHRNIHNYLSEQIK